MKRHEIWTAAGGPGYAGKPRPVIVLQNHNIRSLSSITTCGFTSDETEAPDLRPLIRAGAENGLLSDSRAMVDKIMTMPRACMGQRIGQLAPADSAAIDLAVMLFLGFSD